MVFDFPSAYSQIEVEPDSREFLAFSRPAGLYGWTWRPFGAAAAPGTRDSAADDRQAARTNEAGARYSPSRWHADFEDRCRPSETFGSFLRERWRGRPRTSSSSHRRVACAIAEQATRASFCRQGKLGQTPPKWRLLPVSGPSGRQRSTGLPGSQKLLPAHSLELCRDASAVAAPVTAKAQSQLRPEQEKPIKRVR